MLAHACNTGTQKAEAGGLLGVQGHQELQNESAGRRGGGGGEDDYTAGRCLRARVRNISVYKVLALQAWGPEFSPSEPV